MSRYRITPEIVERLKPLSNVTSGVITEFLAALESKALVSTSIEDDTKRLSAEIPGLMTFSDGERLELCNALVGVHYLRSTPGMTSEEYFADIREAAESAEYQEKEISTLLSNVELVVSSRVLRASIKAWALLSDEERIYLNGRVLTDVRPVFGDDDCNTLLASVVLHTLKIATQVDGRPKNIHVALDTDDLVDLRRAIDRALDKAKVLGEQLSATALAPVVGTSSQRK